MDNNTLSFLDPYPENQLDRGGSPFTPATIHGLIGSSNEPPWVFPQAVDNRTISCSNDGLPHQAAMVLKTAVPQTSKQKELQPSKRSSTTSSTLAWSITTPGPKSVQLLAVDKPEAKLPPRSGLRNGPLAAEVAEHARVMRKFRSCYSCRLVKYKVI